MAKDNEKKTGPGAGKNRKVHRPYNKPKSDVSGLKNSVFEYGLAKHAAQYVETEKAIANYIQREYTKGGPDIAEAIRDEKLPTVIIPPKPTGGDEFDKPMWFHRYERARDKKAILEAAGKRPYAF